MPTASDYAMMMAEHRKSQPRPISKLYGAKGPTPSQLSSYQAQNKKWNAEYRRLSKLQKSTLTAENAARNIIRQLEPLLK